MAQRVFTGTWEEIARHAPEFEGRQVRLTVLSEEETPRQEELRARMMQLFAEWDAAERTPIPPSSDPVKRIWEESVEEKARKQGLII